MEEKPKARLDDYLLGTAMGLCVILVYLVPMLVLNYNVCTAPRELAELRTLLCEVTFGIAAVAAFVLSAAWRFTGSRKLMYSSFFVLVGLGTFLAWYVLYHSMVCMA